MHVTDKSSKIRQKAMLIPNYGISLVLHDIHSCVNNKKLLEHDGLPNASDR
jgi:hypothetical protein